MKAIIAKLKAGEEVEYGFLGVAPSQDVQRHEGVVVDRVTEGSPAFQKLQPGDRILAINGIPVRDVDELFLTVGMLFAGSEVRLLVRTPNRPERSEKVTLAKFYVGGPGKIIASKKPAAIRGIRVDYTSVLFMRNPTNRGSISPGVLVREVLPGSAAATAQLHVNEVITHVNNHPVNTPAEFY